jgi:hypothetical protein
VDLVLFLACPGKVYFVVPAFVAAKLYANTVVVIFNNRASITLSDNAKEGTAASVSHTRRPHASRTTGDVHFVNPEASVYSQHDRVAIQKSIVVWDDANSKIEDDMEVSISAYLRRFREGRAEWWVVDADRQFFPALDEEQKGGTMTGLAGTLLAPLIYDQQASRTSYPVVLM